MATDDKSNVGLSSENEGKVEVEASVSFDIDYVRNEIQKIIDKHSKGDKKISVENLSLRELKLLVDLLLGDTTFEEQEQKFVQDCKNLNETYDEILNLDSKLKSVNNLDKDSTDELQKLKEDFLLGNKLDLL